MQAGPMLRALINRRNFSDRRFLLLLILLGLCWWLSLSWRSPGATLLPWLVKPSSPFLSTFYLWPLRTLVIELWLSWRYCFRELWKAGIWHIARLNFGFQKPRHLSLFSKCRMIDSDLFTRFSISILNNVRLEDFITSTLAVIFPQSFKLKLVIVRYGFLNYLASLSFLR